MKISVILFVGATVFLSACSTTPKENDQQALESNLSEATFFLKVLNTLDSGDVAKTRRIAMIPVCVDISSLPYFAANGQPTPEQRQQLVVLARDTMGYLSKHRQEFDGRLPSIQMCLRGLTTILTEPDDIRQLQELSNYFAEAEKKVEPK